MTECRAIIAYLHTVAGPFQTHSVVLPGRATVPGHPTAPPPHRHTTRVSPFSSGRGHRRGCSRETGLRRAEFSVWASALQVLCSPHVHCAHTQVPPSAGEPQQSLPSQHLAAAHPRPPAKAGDGAAGASTLRAPAPDAAPLSAAPACVAGAREGQAQAVGRKGGDRQKSYLTFSQFLLEGKVLISRLIC